MSETVEKKTYKGNCHCGQVRFTVEIPPLETIDIVRCNCVICTKHGRLSVFPDVTDVTFTHGYDTMAEYWCTTRTCPHKFCRNCGTPILVDLSKTSAYPGKYSLTIRTFEGIEDILDKLTYTTFDGKNKFKPEYSLPEA